MATIHWRRAPTRSTIGLHTNLRLKVKCSAEVKPTSRAGRPAAVKNSAATWWRIDHGRPSPK